MSEQQLSVAKFPAGGSFEYFVEEFLLNNRPCLFDESLTRQWPSRQLWVDDQGRPNLDYLSKEYGMCVCTLVYIPI